MCLREWCPATVRTPEEYRRRVREEVSRIEGLGLLRRDNLVSRCLQWRGLLLSVRRLFLAWGSNLQYDATETDKERSGYDLFDRRHTFTHLVRSTHPSMKIFLGR